jgi:outer membrane lipoprotein LolB
VSAPDAPQLESIGTDGRLASLEQFGWWVRYLRYQSVSGIALPARMEIESEGTRMRLAIANWTLVP